jgi:hypothetical protein
MKVWKAVYIILLKKKKKCKLSIEFIIIWDISEVSIGIYWSESKNDNEWKLF